MLCIPETMHVSMPKAKAYPYKLSRNVIILIEFPTQLGEMVSCIKTVKDLMT